jgi:hypothetical protein
VGGIPPRHGLELDTLNVIRRLSWSPVDADVGELQGGWLAVAGDGVVDARWCAGEQHAPAGLAPRLVSKEAYAALRDGRLLQDGALLWQSKRWLLADVAEGGRLVARLVAEGVAA